ncbi:GPP34 family phosphoprotein [Kitasatospora sp. NPDC059811]|uniref:GOLPH3/VPS74 family protein n=1 Tax=Streptomycetaceae TaxID=2062 RepID=UPI0007AF4B8E|nr:GPP34 family phosphoprotein [Streptomyces sp. MJM8645]
MHVTLAEELMLLSLDDKSGAAKAGTTAGWAVAGGFLADLALAGRVVVDDGRLTVTDRTPTGEPLLDGRLDRLAEWAERKGAGKAKPAEWLAKDQPTAIRDTVQRLCERGLVVEERHRALGLFPVRRYPEADGSVERALRARLAAVVLDGAEPDVRTATLIALLHTARLYKVAFPEQPRKQVEPRFAEIAEGDWAGESVGQAIRNMQAAVAAIAAVTIATTAATTVIT